MHPSVAAAARTVAAGSDPGGVLPVLAQVIQLAEAQAAGLSGEPATAHQAHFCTLKQTRKQDRASGPKQGAVVQTGYRV